MHYWELVMCFVILFHGNLHAKSFSNECTVTSQFFIPNHMLSLPCPITSTESFHFIETSKTRIIVTRRLNLTCIYINIVKNQNVDPSILCSSSSAKTNDPLSSWIKQ